MRISELTTPRHSMIPLSLNRRAFLRLTGMTAAAVFAPPLHSLAQVLGSGAGFLEHGREMAAKAPFSAKTLRGDVGVAMNGVAGNVGVLHAGDGGLLVDSSYSTAGPRLWDAVESLGVKKLKLLVNTHWHADHTDGNAGLHAHGGRILAHERTRYWLERDQVVNLPEVFDHVTFPRAPQAGLPQEVVTTERTLRHGGETVHIRHYPAAHTDSDIAIFFEKANVVHTGDLFSNGIFPFIDAHTGGRLDGMVSAGRKILSVTSADTMFIPGHGPIATPEDYKHFLTMLEEIGGKVRTMKQAGKSADEVASAHVASDFESSWGKGFFNGDQFARVVYTAV